MKMSLLVAVLRHLAQVVAGREDQNIECGERALVEIVFAEKVARPEGQAIERAWRWCTTPGDRDRMAQVCEVQGRGTTDQSGTAHDEDPFDCSPCFPPHGRHVRVKPELADARSPTGRHEVGVVGSASVRRA